jgi:hypothetical protein
MGLNKDLISQFQKNIATQMGADELKKQGINISDINTEPEQTLTTASGQPLKIVKTVTTES